MTVLTCACGHPIAAHITNMRTYDEAVRPTFGACGYAACVCREGWPVADDEEVVLVILDHDPR
jgi:hypothetical protein